MRMKKTSLTIAAAFVLLFFTAVSVQAKENMQLTDLAGLLSEQEEQEINNQLMDLEERTDWDLMALTTDDADGMDATTFAEVWFDKYTTRDDGIICAIDMDNREIVVRAFGEAMYYITDARTDKILDAGYAEISDEAYFATLQEMLHEVEHAYRQEDPNQNYLYDEDTGGIIYYRDGKGITLSEILIALGLAILAGGGTVSMIFRKYRLKSGGYKYPIEKNGNINVTVSDDQLVNSFVTTRQIPKPRNSNGGSGQSSVHGNTGGHSTAHKAAGGRSTIHRAASGSSTAHKSPSGRSTVNRGSTGRSSSGGSRSISSGGSRRSSSGGSRSISSGGSRRSSSGGSRSISSGGSKRSSSAGSRRSSSGGSRRF